MLVAAIPFFDDDPVFAPTPTPADTQPPLVNSFGLDTVLIDGYPIDAVVSEKHDFDLDVTEYPVEKGADITDHVRPKPLKISLDCFVSDLPFGPIANHPTRVIGSPSSDIYGRLVAMRDNPQPITVVTSLKTYDSMVLSRVSFPRNSGEPTGIRFTAEFVKVLIVQDTRVSIAAAVTAKTTKLAAIASASAAGIPCYLIAPFGQDVTLADGEVVGPVVVAESAPNFLDVISDGSPQTGSAAMAAGSNTPPATGVWIIAVNLPSVIAQNQILMSQNLPLLHQGYNSYAANPALRNMQSFVPQTTMLTSRSNAPVTQSPGDVNQDAIDQAFGGAGPSLF